MLIVIETLFEIFSCLVFDLLDLDPDLNGA